MLDFSIIVAGFGGQGILSAGRIVAASALLEGREVSWFPSYGPEMRGGTANCSVVISDESISSPVINECDVLIAMNSPSLAKFSPQVKPGGIVIVDSSLAGGISGREDIRCVAIPASDMASEKGNMTFATIILLGCLAGSTKCFRRETFEKALFDTLPERHHHFIPEEMEVFDLGMEYSLQPADK